MAAEEVEVVVESKSVRPLQKFERNVKKTKYELK
jgi:hypothetical protein